MCVCEGEAGVLNSSQTDVVTGSRVLGGKEICYSVVDVGTWLEIRWTSLVISHSVEQTPRGTQDRPTD